MTIKSLNNIISIDDDLNTHINGERQPLFSYAMDEKHQKEKVKSIHIQDNGVVIIKTMKGNN